MLLLILTFDSSPIKETFAKLSGTAIVCSDSQSAKLDFPIDSRLRGNDGVVGLSYYHPHL